MSEKTPPAKDLAEILLEKIYLFLLRNKGLSKKKAIEIALKIIKKQKQITKKTFEDLLLEEGAFYVLDLDYQYDLDTTCKFLIELKALLAHSKDKQIINDLYFSLLDGKEESTANIHALVKSPRLSYLVRVFFLYKTLYSHKKIDNFLKEDLPKILDEKINLIIENATERNVEISSSILRGVVSFLEKTAQINLSTSLSIEDLKFIEMEPENNTPGIGR